MFRIFAFINIISLLTISISAYATDGIVISNYLNFREDPSTKSKIIEKLHKGVHVKVIKTRHAWFYIRTEKNQQGWVAKKYIQIQSTKKRAVPKSRITILKTHIKNHYEGRKYALVIGINAYPSLPLEAAVNDAKTVAKRLKELGFKVTTLLDKQATLKRIRSELGTKLANTQKTDQVLIYFAGHGVTEDLPNHKKEGYILPVDSNIKDIYSTAISMTELRDLSRRIPAKHLLYIFDSCYSGLGLDRGRKLNINKYNRANYLKKLAGQRAVYMITAGKADEVAREIGNHGIFTLKFLEGMAGAADMEPKDKVIQSSELGRFLAKEVAQLSNGQQHPQYGLLEGKGDFLFPLFSDDPKQLKTLRLSLLEFQYKKILKRKSLQQQFDEFLQELRQSKKREKDQYDRDIALLDQKIAKINQEIKQFSQQLGINKNSLINQDYSTIKFLNTQKEIKINKVFDNAQVFEQYFSNIFNVNFKLPTIASGRLPYSIEQKLIAKLKKANSYQTKIKSYTDKNLPLRREIWEQPMMGVVGKITLDTLIPAFVLKNINEIQSDLKNNYQAYINHIQFDINDITSNQKLFTFKQIKKLMIAKYGKPTATGRKIYSLNWKTGVEDVDKEQIWENQSIKVTLTARLINKKDFNYYDGYYNISPKCFPQKNKYKKGVLLTPDIKNNPEDYCDKWEGWKAINLYHISIDNGFYLKEKDRGEYPTSSLFSPIDTISIKITNKYPAKIYKQIYKLFEAQEFILLRKRIAKMAKIERDRIKAMNALSL